MCPVAFTLQSNHLAGRTEKLLQAPRTSLQNNYGTSNVEETNPSLINTVERKPKVIIKSSPNPSDKEEIKKKPLKLISSIPEVVKKILTSFHNENDEKLELVSTPFTRKFYKEHISDFAKILHLPSVDLIFSTKSKKGRPKKREDDVVLFAEEDPIENEKLSELASADDAFTKKTTHIRTKEEKRLERAVISYQQGNTDVFDSIYNIYRPKFDRLAFRMNDEDITQELSYALLKAVRTFKTNMPAKFNTYFWKIARNHIGTLKIKNKAKKRTAEGGVVSINQLMTMEGTEVEFGDMIVDETFEERFEEATLRAFLHNNVFNHLKTIDIQAIVYYLKGYTLEEVGEKMGGITAPAIYTRIKNLRSNSVIFNAIRTYFVEQGYILPEKVSINNSRSLNRF